MSDDTVPNAAAPIAPPVNESSAVTAVELSVATLAAGYNIIPSKNVKVIVSHSLLLKNTAIPKNNGQKIPIRNTFEIKHIIRPFIFTSNALPVIEPAATVPNT